MTSKWTPRVMGDLLAERKRQQVAEGYSTAHDNEHTGGELALAAICYIRGTMNDGGAPNWQLWPWEHRAWKPKTRRENLVRAAALLVAEIERIDREKADEDERNWT